MWCVCMPFLVLHLCRDEVFKIYRDINSGGMAHSDQQLRKWVATAAARMYWPSRKLQAACVLYMCVC